MKYVLSFLMTLVILMAAAGDGTAKEDRKSVV